MLRAKCSRGSCLLSTAYLDPTGYDQEEFIVHCCSSLPRAFSPFPGLKHLSGIKAHCLLQVCSPDILCPWRLIGVFLSLYHPGWPWGAAQIKFPGGWTADKGSPGTWDVFFDGTAPGKCEFCRLAWTLSQLCFSLTHLPELCHCQQICVQKLQRQVISPKRHCRLTLKPVLFCRCRDIHTPIHI